MSLFDATASALASAATGQAVGIINRVLPASARQAIGAVGDLAGGNIIGAAARVAGSGLLDNLFPGAGGLVAQAAYWNSPIPLFGGLTPAEVKQRNDEFMGQKLARKNLYVIEVSSNLLGDASSVFNLLAVDLEYSPYAITGDKRKVGAATQDVVTSSEPAELRVTTWDDEAGTIKAWFRAHALATVRADGTVGLPSLAAIRVRIVHASLRSDFGPYEDVGLFRAASIDSALSRRDQAMQEISLTLQQIDTFMTP